VVHRLNGPMQTPPENVDNAETVFRRIKQRTDPSKQPQYVREGDRLRVTQVAFQHPSCEISVNRAAYCNNGAHDLIEDETDGVVILTTGQVREFQKLRDQIDFSGEVSSSPLPGVAAHADMHLAPHAHGDISRPEKWVFQKFSEYLKFLAGSNWAIEPAEPRDST